MTLNVNPVESSPGSDCSGCDTGDCGMAGPAENISTNVNMPCYQSCKWRFGVSATADYCYGPCFFNYFSIEDGSSSYLTLLNYLIIVYDFKWDNGCSHALEISYSNTDCLLIHEQYHLQHFLENLEWEQYILRNDSAFDDMSCPMEASSCQEAYNAREQEIRDAVEEAYRRVSMDCDETGAQGAARPCFTAVADSICQNWNCNP